MTEILWMHCSSFFLLLNQCVLYYSIQLGRCALLSFGILALVMLLRGTVFRKNIVFRAMIWGVFLAVPFLGKLKLFEQNLWICRPFLWWSDACFLYWPVRYGYALGIAVSAAMIIRKRKIFSGMIRHMEKCRVCGQEISVSEQTATPFAAGLFHTKIVIPKAVLDNFSMEELEMILLHENTHIRLGHLWYYLAWNVIQVLLWPDFLLKVCMKSLKADLEDICDSVTIEKSGRTAYEYGMLILKCIRLLREENVGIAAAFTGEKDYRNVKQRMLRITGHRPYKKWKVSVACVSGLAVLTGIFLLICQCSYPRYTKEYDMVLSNEAGEIWILHDSEMLRNAFQADGKKVYIERKVMDTILREYQIEETDFWLLFGGYQKLPGMGGGGSLVHVDYSGPGDRLEIPYQDSDQYFTSVIYKIM